MTLQDKGGEIMLNTIKLFLWNVLLTENTIRTICGAFKLNEDDSKNIAVGVVSIKNYLETKDRQHIKIAIHSFEQLIK